MEKILMLKNYSIWKRIRLMMILGQGHRTRKILMTMTMVVAMMRMGQEGKDRKKDLWVKEALLKIKGEIKR